MVLHITPCCQNYFCYTNFKLFAMFDCMCVQVDLRWSYNRVCVGSMQFPELSGMEVLSDVGDVFVAANKLCVGGKLT